MTLRQVSRSPQSRKWLLCLVTGKQISCCSYTKRGNYKKWARASQCTYLYLRISVITSFIEVAERSRMDCPDQARPQNFSLGGG